MTLAQWAESSNTTILSELEELTRSMGYNSIHDYPSILVQEFSLNEKSLKELGHVVGQTILCNSIYHHNFILPIIPFNNDIQPILHVDPSFKEQDIPIITLALSYCLHLIEWHMAFRQGKGQTTPTNPLEDRPFHLLAEFNGESQSFYRYLKKMSDYRKPVNMTNIRSGLVMDSGKNQRKARGDRNIQGALAMINCIDYLAKDLAFSHFGESLWKGDSQDVENEALLDREIGPHWKELRELFSFPKLLTFQESFSVIRRLQIILKKGDDKPRNPLHDGIKFSDQSGFAIAEQNFSTAAELAEQALPIIREWGDSGQLSICLTNLHSAYCGLHDIGKAESIYGECISAAEKAGDFLSLAYLAHNAMNLADDTPRMLREFNRSIGALESMSQKDFTKNNHEIRGFLENQKSYLFILNGLNGFSELAKRWVELGIKAGLK